MTIKEILEYYGMSRRELSEKFGIGIRTVEKWCANETSSDHRKCPEYITGMIVRILELEKEKANE